MRPEGMRPDPEIKEEAERALRQDARLESTDIALAVNHGIVLLTGLAPSEEEKWRAASAVARVAGVAGVANDIDVRGAPPAGDPPLARQAADQIRWTLPYSHRFVRLSLRNGWLRLEGDVEWSYQKERAEAAAARVRELAGITNALRVERRIEPAEIKRAVEEAFRQRLPAA
jgi:osmotically-inducible protein OsmY